MSKSLNWNDRFALINHYKPTDEQACTVFGVTKDELKTAREMLTAGAFVASTGIDVASYGNMFGHTSVSKIATTNRTSGATSITKTTTGKTTTSTPVTSTKKPKELKKRGRKGDKIAGAFTSIPSTPTSVEQFATTHGVSVTVLRQSKRFDVAPQLGLVRVRKDKESKTLMIWREATPSTK